VVVIGASADEMRTAISHRATCVLQEPQLGTGHAVMAAETAIAEAAAIGASNVLVAAGDMPLLRAETYASLITQRQNTAAAISMLTVMVDNPRGFGRIVRDASDRVQAIVEEVACTPEQLAIRELNLAVYCFDGAWLWPALKRIQPNPKKGEYFLTDLVEMARQDGREVYATIVEDADECIGINTRVDLADADAALRKRINKQHMLNGVSIVDPLSTYIDVGVEIGQDAIILPNTHVLGATKIGNESVIGPNSLLRNATIGARVEIRQSVIHDSRVDDDADVGPFSHLRNGAHVAAGAHVGNFAEIKKSTLGKRSKMGHFSYLGDATVGEDANLGAGMITANYDGVNKHETRIGDNAFIGSDTILRAPVCVGDGAATGAGAIVTKDVPENSLAVGMPARVIRKRG
jgi:bifunctional UDP-N-acetylglucosamine pyrophosphorylase/glucosamine-1-phosphate N-acetyltransferase